MVPASRIKHLPTHSFFDRFLVIVLPMIALIILVYAMFYSTLHSQPICSSGVLQKSTSTEPVSASSQASVLPRVFTLDPHMLWKIRKQVQANSSKLSLAISNLMKEADVALDTSPFSVVEKSAIPPSGDKHDYMSLSTYGWPDPNTTSGLPYISRDTEINPEIYDIPDSMNLIKLVNTTKELSLAYYFSGDNKYAVRAANLLRVWFLDEKTRMNPSLKYAQIIKGVNNGSSDGIIDARFFSDIVDNIGLIECSSAWSKNDTDAMKSWFKNYLEWLLFSDSGKTESKTKNNHGSWYDVQAASIALFVDDEKLATNILNRLLCN